MCVCVCVYHEKSSYWAGNILALAVFIKLLGLLSILCNCVPLFNITCPRICVCVCVYIYIYVSLPPSLSLSLSLSLYIYIYIYICMLYTIHEMLQNVAFNLMDSILLCLTVIHIDTNYSV